MSTTGTNIQIIEKNLPMDRINALVGALEMDPKRFISTVMLACERNPRLMDMPVGAHVQWASSAAVLGLEPDGVTGQAWPIPFGSKIQLVVGYRGFNTMAGRAGITINSGAIYEGDIWDSRLTAGKPFALEQAFGNRANANLIGTWAQPQMANGSYGHPLVMDLSEILAVKAKAPGGRESDSPWNDPKVGFPAMAQKTSIRRLQRTLPSLITPGRNFSTHATGAQMDMLHEEVGAHATVTLDGDLIDHGPIEAKPETPEIQPALTLPNGEIVNFGAFVGHVAVINRISITNNPDTLKGMQAANKKTFADWRTSGDRDALAAADAIEAALDERLIELDGSK